jgi:hypothetical protein
LRQQLSLSAAERLISFLILGDVPIRNFLSVGVIRRSQYAINIIDYLVSCFVLSDFISWRLFMSGTYDKAFRYVFASPKLFPHD